MWSVTSHLINKYN